MDMNQMNEDGTKNPAKVDSCPICGFKGKTEFEECPRCGLIIAKYLARQAKKGMK